MFDSVELLGQKRLARAYYWSAAGLAILAIAAFAAFSAVDDTGAAGGIFLGGIAVLGITLLAFFALGKPSRASSQRLDQYELLQALGESSPDGLLILRDDGAVLYANPAYQSLVGVSDLDRVLPIDRAYAGYPEISGPLYRLSKGVKSGVEVTESVVLPSEQGEEQTVRISARPLILKDKATREQRASLWQITTLDSRPAREKEELSRDVSTWIENPAISCFVTDRDGHVVGLSQRMREIVNTDGESAIGAPWQNVFSSVEKISDDGLLSRFAGTGCGENAQSESVEILLAPDLLEPDGTSLGLVNVVGSRGIEPAAAGDQIVPIDVLENAPIAIAWVGHDGSILNSNAACRTLVGNVAEDGHSLVSLFDDGFQSDVQAAFDAALDGEATHLPGEIRLSTQREMFSQVSILPSATVGGRTGAAAIVYLIDTTEQKTLEVQFAQSQKMQAVGQLAGGVAHDFNNMLTAMIGFCDLLLAKHQPGDPSFADIMQIKQNANRAANLVRHLLAFSRQQTLRPTVFWLPDTISDIKDLLKRLLGETVSLEIKHDRDLGLVKVDEGQFEQALINLCVNARDAMPNGGTLTIRTENVSKAESAQLGHALMPAADYVMIEVSDTGTGIAKEDLGKIFEPFFTTKEVGQGTGLGLSMVYGVVKQTGGFIFPDSTVGKGTAFRIYLPLHVEAEASETTSAAPTEAPEKRDLTGMGKILLVEDEEAVRSFASRALATRGYTVIEASSGLVALDLMREQGEEIDLVVSDVVMPEMDGPTLVRESKEFCPNAKIIFISGYAEDAFQKNLDPDEEFTFLPKPFSLKQLAEKVKEVMNSAA